VTSGDRITSIAHTNAALVAEFDRLWPQADADARDDALALLVLAHASAAREGHLLVIGAGHGWNATALGTVARTGSHGRVFAVDLYPECDDDADGDGGSMDSFLSRVVAAGLTQWVLPHYGTATTFAQLVPADFRCRLVHVESAPACSTIETDLFLLAGLLAPGGWLTLGVGFSGFPGAADAIDVLRRQRVELVDWTWITPRLLAARKVHPHGADRPHPTPFTSSSAAA
jgi:hypothetical protein